MFLKELKDTLRQTGFIMAFFILIPMLYLADHAVYRTGLTFIEYMSNGLDLFILIMAFCLAYNMFKVEESDGATEYLLSLPISRWDLLKYKVMPRIAILTVLLLIGSIVNNLRISDGSVLGLIFMNWRAGFSYMLGFIIFLQICGFMLGLIGRKSWITRLMLLVMVLCVWQYGCITLVLERAIWFVFGLHTSFRVSFWLGQNGYAFVNNIFAYTLLAYILVPLCRNWDLKSLRVREIWFQKRALLPMLVFSLLLANRYLAFSFRWWW